MEGDDGRDGDPERATPRAAFRPEAVPIPSLKTALRAARVEEAERTRAIGDLAGVDLARLTVLRDALEPVFAQVPTGTDLFDAGLMPGLHPRLFIDMVSFVEMGRDKRQYRFIQDLRHGRVLLAESDRVDVIQQAVTAYIARRLVEREKALASAAEVLPPTPAPRHLWPASAAAAFDLVLRYLGIVALCVLLWVFGWALFQYLWTHW